MEKRTGMIRLQWYQVSSIPVLLAMLLAGYVVMMLLEIAAEHRPGYRRVARWLYGAAFVGYSVVYLYLTFFSRVPDGLHRIRMVPFYAVMHLVDEKGFHLRIFREVVLNIALYVPFGAMTMGLVQGTAHPVRKACIVAFAVTLLTEAAQYALGLGLAEADDIINNMLGALLGIMGFISAHAVAQTLTE